MRVTLFSCGPAANESELIAFKHLESRLRSTGGDDEWVVLTNLAFSVTSRVQSDEIDIVAIGPPGVRVIEVKHWTAQWVDERMEDLVAQEAERVTEKARRIGTTLRKIVANLPRVDGAILLTQEPSKVKRLAGKEVRGVTLYSLNEWRGASGTLIPDRNACTALKSQTKIAIDDRLKRSSGIGGRPQMRNFPGIKIPDEAGSELCPGFKYSSPGFKVPRHCTIIPENRLESDAIVRDYTAARQQPNLGPRQAQDIAQIPKHRNLGIAVKGVLNSTHLKRRRHETEFKAR